MLVLSLLVPVYSVQTHRDGVAHPETPLQTFSEVCVLGESRSVDSITGNDISIQPAFTFKYLSRGMASEFQGS